MKKIIFSIDNKGRTTIVDAIGFGGGCVNATAEVERRLGLADEATRAATDSLRQPEEQAVAVAG